MFTGIARASLRTTPLYKIIVPVNMARLLFVKDRLFGLIVVMIILWTGCDSLIEEKPEFARVEFRLRRIEGEAFLVTAAAQARPSFSDQETISFDTLSVRRGFDYEGFVRFFDQDGRDITSMVRTKKEERQIFYTLRDVEGVTIRVADKENEYGRNEFGENLPVGLRFYLFVPLGFRGSRGEMRVQLVAFPNQVKNGVNAQGGETKIDFDLPLVVNPLPGPQALDQITRAVLTLEPLDGSQAQTVTAANPAGLHLGAVEVDTLRVEPDKLYTGRIELFNDATGEELTDQIRADAAYYQFSYDVFHDEWLDLDVDENGLPFGQAFTYDLRGRRIFRGGLVRLVQYEPNFGGEKGLSESGQVVMEFRLFHRAGI